MVLPCELDPRDVELLAFVDVDVEGDVFFASSTLGVRDGGEVDVSQLAIGLAQIFQSLADQRWR